MIAVCDFANPELTCPHCGFKAGAPDWRKNCPRRKPDPPPPTLGQRIKNFSLAAITHVVHGCPTCTQQQIDARYAVCRTCPLYKPDANNPDVGVCTHQLCGCNVAANAFLNKLAWADQACPLGKWPAIK